MHAAVEDAGRAAPWEAQAAPPLTAGTALDEAAVITPSDHGGGDLSRTTVARPSPPPSAGGPGGAERSPQWHGHGACTSCEAAREKVAILGKIRSFF